MYGMLEKDLKTTYYPFAPGHAAIAKPRWDAAASRQIARRRVLPGKPRRVRGLPVMRTR
jgi:hypothetical protein